MKDLIVCYSYSGNTELVARTLAGELGADVKALEDVKKPSKLKAYVSGALAARKGQAWPVKPLDAGLAQYGRIFVGAPIWWGKCAPEINAFIDSVDFAGKQVVVFVTMGGSDPKSALDALTSRIAARGGTVVSSFAIRTGGMKPDAVAAKAREIAGQYKK